MDVSQLSHGLTPMVTRPVVQGRHLLVDGDFVAYFVSTDTTSTLQTMQEHADTCLANIKAAAGAEFMRIHMTARGSSKGDRFKIARLKPYQGNRVDKVKPTELENIRTYILEKYNSGPNTALLWNDLEADDGISIDQHNKDLNSSGETVIISRDKDLGIIPGLHLDWMTHKLYTVDFAGVLTYLKTETKGKLLGTGFKFFCAQMLMGDRADNISGLPRLVKNGALKLCGPKAAYDTLAGIDDPGLCVRRVLLEYRNYGALVGFKDYNGNDMTAEEAFESEARLLWLRRTLDADDVLTVFKEVNNGKALY